MPPDVKVDRVVVFAYLDEVTSELEAVRRLLVPPPSRYAVYHLQQAAEKLAKAVRLARGLQATKDHALEILIDGLPRGDIWRARLEPFEWLSAYATTYRYPTATRGFRQAAPAVEKIETCIRQVEERLTEARADFANL
jgi:HEPN domain-containing protein